LRVVPPLEHAALVGNGDQPGPGIQDVREPVVSRSERYRGQAREQVGADVREWDDKRMSIAGSESMVFATIPQWKDGPMGSLTILEDIRFATPCTASWNEMPGDDRVRWCPACSRAVYNIAAMTSTEAAALIANREGRLCARLFRRDDGTVVTSDCPAVAIEAPPVFGPKSRLRRTKALAIVLVALLLVWSGTSAREAPPPGAGVSWEDWVHWAAVTLGLRLAPSVAPNFTTTVSMGDVY
jgi:hypothetical protein